MDLSAPLPPPPSPPLPPPPPPSPLRQIHAGLGASEGKSTDEFALHHLPHDRSVAPPRPPPPFKAKGASAGVSGAHGHGKRNGAFVIDVGVDDENFRLPPPAPKKESAKRGKAPQRPPLPSQVVGATGNKFQGLPSLTPTGPGMPMPIQYFAGQNPFITIPFPALPELRENADENANENANENADENADENANENADKNLS